MASVSLMLMPLTLNIEDENNTDSSNLTEDDVEATARDGDSSRPPSRPGLAKTTSIIVIDQKSSRKETW